MGSIASGGKENYCVVGEYMQIENLFLNDFIKSGKFSLKFLSVG
jgi:hypothetical protein